MPNTCPIIITRGKNKGKACGSVNKKCRHKNIQCPNCNGHFTVETSYIRHQAVCKGKGKSDLKTSPRKQEAPIRTIKIRVKTLDDTDTTLSSININSNRNNNAPDNNVLLEKIEQLERELNVVKNKPAVHHHWNIVLGGNFYDELVDKMGKSHAINYLTELASTGKPIDIINKLYLEGNSPEKYPIACRNNTGNESEGIPHFRYIGSDHRLIDDKGGRSISKIVSSGVHNAMLLAANEAINEQVENRNYDDFNIGPIQRYAANMRNTLPQDHIISELSHMTRIPNHPFFTDEDSFKIESTLSDN